MIRIFAVAVPRWNADYEHRSLAGTTGDFDVAVHECRAFAHAEKTERLGLRNSLRVDPHVLLQTCLKKWLQGVEEILERRVKVAEVCSPRQFAEVNRRRYRGAIAYSGLVLS